jgi:hypothetical protein
MTQKAYNFINPSKRTYIVLSIILAKSSRAVLANVCRRAVELLRRLRKPTGSHATILRLQHTGYLTLRRLLAILDMLRLASKRNEALLWLC